VEPVACFSRRAGLTDIGDSLGCEYSRINEADYIPSLDEINRNYSLNPHWRSGYAIEFVDQVVEHGWVGFSNFSEKSISLITCTSMVPDIQAGGRLDRLAMRRQNNSSHVQPCFVE